MQDRANVSADFLDLMRREIIDVIKKYIEIDDSEIDVQLTNMQKEDGTVGAPVLHANIPIVKIKNEAKKKAEEIAEHKEIIEEKEPKKQEKSENTSKKNEEKQEVKEDINQEAKNIEEKEKEVDEQATKQEEPEESNLAKDLLKEVAEIIKSEENKKN